MMGPGSLKIFDRTSAVEAIKCLSEKDLLFLNRVIVALSTELRGQSFGWNRFIEVAFYTKK